MDWVDLAARFGIPIIILFAVGWFTYREAWPFVKGIVENERQARSVEHTNFISALAKRDEINERMLDSLNQLTGAVNDLRERRRRTEDRGGSEDRRRG